MESSVDERHQEGALKRHRFGAQSRRLRRDGEKAEKVIQRSVVFGVLLSCATLIVVLCLSLTLSPKEKMGKKTKAVKKPSSGKNVRIFGPSSKSVSIYAI
ncbi:hypothetical protein PIB30_064655 [Stylosanthes scabra]|uniref:Transmembrane protein n=1 Tax=Stylosanthes scabra TaxID=79078 RepID=A0ABU6QMN4_9FABA|nr:hypothetical protein [Stylosanthes scabra]